MLVLKECLFSFLIVVLIMREKEPSAMMVEADTDIKERDERSSQVVKSPQQKSLSDIEAKFEEEPVSVQA